MWTRPWTVIQGLHQATRRAESDLLRAALPRGQLRAARAADRGPRRGAGLRGGTGSPPGDTVHRQLLVAGGTRPAGAALTTSSRAPGGSRCRRRGNTGPTARRIDDRSPAVAVQRRVRSGEGRTACTDAPAAPVRRRCPTSTSDPCGNRRADAHHQRRTPVPHVFSGGHARRAQSVRAEASTAQPPGQTCSAWISRSESLPVSAAHLAIGTMPACTVRGDGAGRRASRMPVEIDLGMPPAGYAAAPKRATDTTGLIQYREFTSTEDGQHFIQRLEGFPNDILQKVAGADPRFEGRSPVGALPS